MANELICGDCGQYESECHCNAGYNNFCVLCYRPAETFRDESSRKEFSISGLCQACQDKVFKPNEDNNDGEE